MPNVTLAVDDRLLRAAREYAQARNTTLNALVRQLLAETVMQPGSSSIDEFQELARQHAGASEGRTWTREEIYDRPVLRR